MTIKETTAIMDILKAGYPNFYKGQPGNEQSNAIKLWATMFADDEPELVAAAVKAFIATDIKGFPPVIGVIKNKIAEIKKPGKMPEYEAWNLVKIAIGNGLYGASEEFEKLPPVLQRLVGSPNKLREWAMMNSETLESVVASNFMRSYKVRAEHEREDLLLPSDVKNFIAGFTERMKMPELPPSLSDMTEFEINERRNEIHGALEA